MPSFRSLFRALQGSPETVPETTAADSDSSIELWRKGPVWIWPLGLETSAVQALHSDSVFTVPSKAAAWASGCTTWKPLEEHIQTLRAQHGSDPHFLETLLSAVPLLTDAGLLVSDKNVWEWIRSGASDPGHREAITAIGFPTGGMQGLELAPRAVRSFAENLALHHRNAELVVCDSSLDAALRNRYRQQFQALNKELGREVRYLGAEEKRNFASDLVRMNACSPDVAEFALGDPLQTGFAPGANRNMLLLAQAGTMLCSVDHDVLCRTTGAPECVPAPVSFFSECDPFARWTFPDAAEAERITHWETPDFLSLHEDMLGRGVHELIPAETHHEEVSLGQARDTILRRLASGPARIRATFFGHSGEPGVPSAAYYLAYRGENRRRLTRSEAHYRASLTSRSLLALSPTPAVGDASLSPGVAFGMDHRELLPPFFPVLHAEDFSWSALAWQCCPGMVIGLVPKAIDHAPIPGKAFIEMHELQGLPPFVIWEWAHLLRFWTMTWNPPSAASAGERLRAFARTLGEIATLSPQDFAAELRRAALATASHQIAFYESQLHAAEEDLPEYWTADVDAYLLHLERSITRDGFEVPLDLQQRSRSLTEARAFAQQLLKRYAQLLAAWPDMVAAAREVRSKDAPGTRSQDG